MSASVKLLGFPETFEPPGAKLHDEAVWHAWVAKGGARDRRNSSTRIKVVKLISTAALLTTAALWSNVAPVDAVIKFVVAIGAVVVMLQAFHTRNYSVAALFGALALLYNPVAPAFSLAGDWQRAVVIASSIPFIASLVWRGARTT